MDERDAELLALARARGRLDEASEAREAARRVLRR